MLGDGGEFVMMTREQIEACQTALLTRQTTLINKVHNNFGLSTSEKDSVGELSSYDNHPADMGTETFERGKDIALNEHTEKELEDINKALHAISDGTYGICAVCGADISYERLMALPTADRCAHHAKEENFEGNDRPVEEAAFHPDITSVETIEEERVGYDREDAWQEVSQYGTSETPSDFYGDQDSYDEMYPNSDELIGSVEQIEDTLKANRHGYHTEDGQEFE